MLIACKHRVGAVVDVLERRSVRVTADEDVGAGFSVLRDEDLTGTGTGWGRTELCHGVTEARGEGSCVESDAGGWR